MPEKLNPTGTPITIETITLRTPGLEGVAEAHMPGSPGMRAAERTTTLLDEAMASEGLRAGTSIEIEDASEVPAAGRGTRSTSFGEPAIEMDVPAPSKGWEQVVLSSDEATVLSWNFAIEQSQPGDTGTHRSASGTRKYLIRRAVTKAESAPKTRGLIGAVGRKILKVVAFKLLDPIGAALGEHFAKQWETAKRPYRFRTFTPDDYNQAEGRILESADWTTLGSKRALLMVHGTMSRAHGAFGSLSRSVVEELHRRYEGRVFAFDHFTLSDDPHANLDWFCKNLAADQRLDVDIVCHSRGGLISRLLSERAAELSLGTRQINVGKVVFVAAPNAGTILASDKYMGDFIDSYTNLLNFLPDTGVIEVLQGVITVVKQLAVGALRGLEGLQSMNPQGKFISTLNQGPSGTTRYYALAANFEPTVPGFKTFAADRITDKIFHQDNDLVVPTGGVYGENGRGGFPIEEKLVFPPTSGIGHTNFFGQPDVHEKILTWLA